MASLPQGSSGGAVFRRPGRDRDRHTLGYGSAQCPRHTLGLGAATVTTSPAASPFCLSPLRNGALWAAAQGGRGVANCAGVPSIC